MTFSLVNTGIFRPKSKVYSLGILLYDNNINNVFGNLWIIYRFKFKIFRKYTRFKKKILDLVSKFFRRKYTIRKRRMTLKVFLMVLLG
jgi:hypothetical protein